MILIISSLHIMTINHYLQSAHFCGGTILCVREREDKSSLIFVYLPKEKKIFLYLTSPPS